MPLFPDDRVFVEKGLYDELQNNLGQQAFSLYQGVTNVHPHRRGAAGAGNNNNNGSNSRTSRRGDEGRDASPSLRPSFPPLLTSFTLRQSKQAVRKNQSAINVTPELRNELATVLGEQNVKLLESSIGFSEKSKGAGATGGSMGTTLPPATMTSTSSSSFGDTHHNNSQGIYKTVWGEQQKPSYKFSQKPHFSKINNQFFWPNMTNPQCEIPVHLNRPTHVHDLKSWIDTYGEPTVDRIPSRVMSTFRASRRKFGKERSRGVEIVHTATGEEWKKEFDSKRAEVKQQQQR